VIRDTRDNPKKYLQPLTSLYNSFSRSNNCSSVVISRTGSAKHRIIRSPSGMQQSISSSEMELTRLVVGSVWGVVGCGAETEGMGVERDCSMVVEDASMKGGLLIRC
jgi:hypothetical protein